MDPIADDGDFLIGTTMRDYSVAECYLGPAKRNGKRERKRGRKRGKKNRFHYQSPIIWNARIT
jgi:hypothetical protein